MSSLHEDVFAISPDVRYVAIAHGQQVDARSRPGLLHASGSDSDRYEELLVNPALLVLATQRGNIDCGGLRYLIVGYGHFQQLVVPGDAGHVSVAFELDSNPADHLQAILGVVARHEREIKAELGAGWPVNRAPGRRAGHLASVAEPGLVDHATFQAREQRGSTPTSGQARPGFIFAINSSRGSGRAVTVLHLRPSRCFRISRRTWCPWPAPDAR